MDDVAGLMKTKGSKHLSEDLPSLGGDLQIANHVDGLTIVFFKINEIGLDPNGGLVVLS